MITKIAKRKKTNDYFYLFRERFNGLQTKLQELEVLRQSPNEFHRTTTPSSRDSGVPIRSSSSCCSITSESASTPKSSFELPLDQLRSQSPQTSVFSYYLHPISDQHQRHVSVYLDEDITDMSTVREAVPRFHSHGRYVKLDEQKSCSLMPRRSCSQHICQLENSNDDSDLNIIKNYGQRISLNASLPFDSKLHIRINADRKRSDMNKNELHPHQVKATATIEPLNNPKHEQEYLSTLRKNYLQHYSTLPSRDSLIKTRTNSPIQQRTSRRDQLPRHRQVNLPISLPVDQRLYLYIRNGEVLARC